MDGIFKTIKDIPIYEVVNQYCPGTKLKGGRKKLVGSCPLHIDKVPSFTVYFSTNSWFCFSCNKGGDGTRLVQLLTNLSPLEAARTIARDFGAVVDDISPQKVRKRAREAALEKELEEKFNQRVTQAYDVLCFFIRTAEKYLLLEGYGAYLKYNALVHKLPVWNYLADILLNGDLEAKIRVLKIAEVKAWLE